MSGAGLQGVAIDEREWFFFEDGPKDGPTVLVLHGFPDSPVSFASFAEGLASQGFRVLRPYLPGYAPSRYAGPFDIASLCSELLSFLANRCHEPAHLVGHDWGAVLTYAMIGRCPEKFRKAVAISVPHPRHTLRRALRSRAQLVRSLYLLLFQLPRVPEGLARGALVRRLWLRWSPELVASQQLIEEVEACIANSGSAPFDYYRGLARSMADGTLFRDVQVPLLYIHGEHDGCIGVEIATGQDGLFRSAYQCHYIAGAGHFLQLERPEELKRVVSAWLASKT